MPDSKNPLEAEVREVSAKLTEGLEMCRAVVEDYRAALHTQAAAGAEVGPPPTNPAPAAPTDGGSDEA